MSFSVTASEQLQERVFDEANRRGVPVGDLMNRVVETGLAHLPGADTGAVAGSLGSTGDGIPGALGDADLPAFLRTTPDPAQERKEQQLAEAEADRFQRWALGHKRTGIILPLDRMTREHLYEERG